MNRMPPGSNSNGALSCNGSLRIRHVFAGIWDHFQAPAYGGYDPDSSRASEVEIRFHAEEGTTLVELEHSKLGRHGIGAEKMRAIFDAPEAWEKIIADYARAVALS